MDWPLNIIKEDEDRATGPCEIMFEGSVLKIWIAALLGQGTAGTVVAGLWRGEKVAVKILGVVATKDQKDELDREVNHWLALDNSHVLRCLGKCPTGLGQVALLSPYMAHGNMATFVVKDKAADRIKLLQEVAKGLHYLHTEALIVHGDLKCENILVSENGTAILADFGLSTFIEKLEAKDKTKTTIRERRTVPFAAPELFLDMAMHPSSDTGKLMKRSKTMPSDVYAFGMVIYQVITGAAPWGDLIEYPDAIRKKVTDGERPERTAAFSPGLWELCESCWAHEPANRPVIADVLANMTRLVSAAH